MRAGVLAASHLDAAFLCEVGERAYAWWWILHRATPDEYRVWFT